MSICFFCIFPIQGTEYVIVRVQKNTIKVQQDRELLTDFIINKQTMEYLNLHPIVNSVVFSAVGIIILILGYLLIEKLTPENTWKEIVQNKNVALAIVFAALIIGISLIISAAIHG